MWYNSIITTIYCLPVVIRAFFSISCYSQSSQQFNEELYIIIPIIRIKKLRLIHLRSCPKLKTTMRHSTNSIWLPSSYSSSLLWIDTYTYGHIHLPIWVKAVYIDSWIYEATSRVLKNYTTSTLCIFLKLCSAVACYSVNNSSHWKNSIHSFPWLATPLPASSSVRH